MWSNYYTPLFLISSSSLWVRELVYYDSRKRELKKRRQNEDRWDERLKTKTEEPTCLGCTGLDEELWERDGWVCDLDMMGEPTIFKMKRRIEVLVKILSLRVIRYSRENILSDKEK
jgi:hypothetical protein